MMKLNPVKKFWPAVFRNAEGGDGGGAGGDSSGVAPDEGVVDTAGVETTAPAATFLSEAAKAATGEDEDEAATEEEAEGEEAVLFSVENLTLPEGFELDEEVGKSFAEVLADENLTHQERGQKLVELHAEAFKAGTTKIAEEMTKANMDLWAKTNADWRAEIAKLPEFKENPDAEAGKILQALTTIGAGEDFFKALDMTGAGNHPAILQILHRLTAPLIEGGAVSGAGGTKAPRQLGANIYTSTRT